MYIEILIILCASHDSSCYIALLHKNGSYILYLWLKSQTDNFTHALASVTVSIPTECQMGNFKELLSVVY